MTSSGSSTVPTRATQALPRNAPVLTGPYDLVGAALSVLAFCLVFAGIGRLLADPVVALALLAAGLDMPEQPLDTSGKVRRFGPKKAENLFASTSAPPDSASSLPSMAPSPSTAAPAAQAASLPVNVKYMKPEPRNASAGIEIQAGRADIVDVKGRILATNMMTHALYVQTRDLIDPPRVAAELAAIFPELDADTLLRRFTDGRSFLWVRKVLSPEQMQKVHEIGDPGLLFGPREMRLYPNGTLAAHVLGGASFGAEGVLITSPIVSPSAGTRCMVSGSITVRSSRAW